MSGMLIPEEWMDEVRATLNQRYLFEPEIPAPPPMSRWQRLRYRVRHGITMRRIHLAKRIAPELHEWWERES